MEIVLQKVLIRDLVKEYQDLWEDGVFGYGWKLNVRPAYQREFVYKDKQRDAVIDTVRKDFPLNVLYWSYHDDGESLEVLDGQQRIISICQYVNNDYSIDGFQFNNLPKDRQEQILNYELMVYFCTGTESEKLERFKTINIAGVELTNQELRNAVYTWPWLADAKLKFSKSNCPAFLLAKNYVNGSPIRQDFLEKAIAWISDDKIEHYMSQNQHEPNANQLWLYFKSVIDWVEVIFPHYRKEMKGIERWALYHQFKDQKFDSAKLEEEIKRLMMDEDVQSKKGIYEYLLTKDERTLNIRAFSPNMKREAYEKQEGICVLCKEHFALEAMEADHITPRSEWGKTDTENLQMLCRDCNRRKSNN